VHRHHQPELRVGRGVGLQVDRLDVQQRALDRDREHVAADHAGTALVPQGQTLRQHRILIDLGLHLLRPEHAPLLGELVDEEPSVAPGVAHPGDPADHHLPVLRGERQHQHELDVVGLRRTPHHVVRLHGLHVAAILLRGPHPEVLLIVEDLGVGHVVLRVHQPLGQQHARRVADVRLEPLGHRVAILEQPGQRRPPGPDQRIVGLEHVQVEVAVVGVDDHLHRVAYVVRPGEVAHRPAELAPHVTTVHRERLVAREGLAVGVVATGGVRIDDPVQSTIDRHDVGILVELEEGCHLVDPVLDPPTEQHPALVGGIARQHESRAGRGPAEDQAAPEVGELHAAVSTVAGVDVLLAARVVELGLAGVHHHGARRALTVVDGRLVDGERGVASLRREIPDEQLWQPLLGELAHGRHRQPVAVGVLEQLVHEGLAALGEVALLELSRGHEDLPAHPVDVVAVDVDIDELVVQSDLLELPVDQVEGAPVPQPHLVEQATLLVEQRGVELLLGVEAAGLGVVEAEGASGRGDVVLDVGALHRDLVRLDHRPLDQRPHDHEAQRPRDHVQPVAGQDGRDGLEARALGEACGELCGAPSPPGNQR